MRIDELTADEFMPAMAGVVEALGNLVASEAGKAMLEELRRGAGGEEPDAWALSALSRRLPALMRENADDLYGLLAACDGQTLEEYKEAFTPRKLNDDVRALVGFVSDGGLAAFLG